MSLRFLKSSWAVLGLLTFALHVQAETRVSVMQFNVENLFDTVDDANRDDETFLPLAYKKAHREVMAKCDQQSNDRFKQECRETDWNDQVFETKITRVADVIRSVNKGRGPDIQMLVEVENINALTLLRDRKLADLGYKTMELIEGPDTRGIDNAVLSRFPMWDKSQLHVIPFKDKNGNPDKTGSRSRGILEVRLLLPDGQKVAVFVGHFPSMSNPTYLRKQAVAELNRLKSTLPAGVLAIAGGDFNVSAEEDHQQGYISRDLAGEWAVSHLIGCKDCRGTEVFKGEWSFLDNVSFSPSMNNGQAAWQIDIPSISVPHTVKEHVTRNEEPARFLPPSEGVSDHWPLYVEIVKK